MKEWKVLSKPIKVIFLDIDGVLNTGNWISTQARIDKVKHSYDYQINWCPMAFGLLKAILDQYENVYIVISSTWRRSNSSINKLKGIFIDSGHWHRIIGITPIMHWREDEINHYRKHTQNDITRFCVIDDDIFDLTYFKDKELVKCNFRSGLTPDLADKVLEILHLEDEPEYKKRKKDLKYQLRSIKINFISTVKFKYKIIKHKIYRFFNDKYKK
jgi:hypothetical protein